MAYVATRPQTIGFFARLGEIKSQISDAMKARRIYRATLAELSVLSDRELADLGITRASIGAIALEAAYGRLA